MSCRVRSPVSGLAWLMLCIPITVGAAEPHHTLWQVQGRVNVLYLLGSVHLLPPGEPVFTGAIENAYQDAETLVMELDLDDLDAEAVQETTLELGLLPENRSLSDEIGAELYAEVSSRARELGISADMLERFRPWFAGLTLTQLEMMRLGFSADAGVEERFLQRARRDGKEIIGLETFAEQLGMLADMSPGLARQFVAYTLEDIDGLAAEIDTLLAAWRDGDLAVLTGIHEQSFAEFPQLYEPLTVARNRKWVEQLVELLDEADDYLVIVGTLHLVGRDSLIELLESRGFSIVQQ